jgi:hypothetical protein
MPNDGRALHRWLYCSTFAVWRSAICEMAPRIERERSPVRVWRSLTLDGVRRGTVFPAVLVRQVNGKARKAEHSPFRHPPSDGIGQGEDKGVFHLWESMGSSTQNQKKILGPCDDPLTSNAGGLVGPS